MSVKIHSIYDPPAQAGITFTEESQAQQHFAAEADINNIMRRYQSTGVLVDPLHPGTVKPIFGDFSVSFDFKTAQNTIIDANRRFEMLPSEIRARFGNDPGALLDFLNDKENRQEAIKLGLLDLPEEPETPPVVPPKTEA